VPRTSHQPFYGLVPDHARGLPAVLGLTRMPSSFLLHENFMSTQQERIAQAATSTVKQSGSAQDSHDPDLLSTLSATKYRDRRWTLGDSAHLVAGTQKEPVWVSLTWLVVPALLAGMLAYLVVK